LYNTKSGSSNNKSKNSKSLKHLRANLNGTALSYMYVTSYSLFTHFKTSFESDNVIW